jgi:RNA polymerase sigma-70 factor (ECF subfamily)
MPDRVNDSRQSDAMPVTTWLTAARGGSGKARGELFEACRAYLLLIANRELDSDLRAKGGASDLVQETFLEAQQNFNRFQGESEAELLAWLRAILLANLSNFERRYRWTAKRDVSRELPLDGLSEDGKRRLPTLCDAEPSPSWHAVAREEVEKMERAIERLPGDYARVVTLVHREHCSFESAAQMMNRSVDATRRLWSRAIECLVVELGVSHDD